MMLNFIYLILFLIIYDNFFFCIFCLILAYEIYFRPSVWNWVSFILRMKVLSLIAVLIGKI